MPTPQTDQQVANYMNQPQPPTATFFNAMRASSGHAITTMLRQRRIVLATLICLLPVIIPIMIKFFSASPHADSGLDVFVNITTALQITVLCPLLALFFATMLIGQDVEGQTIPFILTRPIPRSAWAFGRFFAYLAVTIGVIGISIFLTFAASTALKGINFSGDDLRLAAHFFGAGAMALVGYGALMMFLGAVSKRPIVIGVILIYGWQPFVNFIPGLIDFFTIQKYVNALLPSLAEHLMNRTVNTAFGEFEKLVYEVSPLQAIITLIIISVTFIMLTVFTTRVREYATSHALGG